MTEHKHKRRRQMYGHSPEAYRRMADHTDEDPRRIAHMGWVFRHDAALAQKAIGGYKNPRIVRGREFKFSGVIGVPRDDEINMVDVLYHQLGKRGLCIVVPLEPFQDNQLDVSASYVDSRITPKHFTNFIRTILDEVRAGSTDNPEEVGLLSDKILGSEQFTDLRAISEEFLGKPQ